VENYIDVNYHWNEWELRRRALKVVALRGCATSASQTDKSHYRRENETQVYEQREKDSQTRQDTGTNPPIVTTYVAGLRGAVPEGQEAVSKYTTSDVDMRADAKGGDSEGKDAKGDAKAEAKPAARVVHLTLDL